MPKPQDYQKIYGMPKDIHAGPDGLPVYGPLTKDQSDWYLKQPRLVRERFRATVPIPRPLYHFRIHELPPYGGGIAFETVDGANFIRGYNRELTVDTLRNPFYDVLKNGVPVDNGGPLTNYKIFWEEHYASQNIISPPDFYFPAGGRTRIWGNVRANTFLEHDDMIPGFNVVTSPEPPSEDLDATKYGAEGWYKAKPLKPKVGLGVLAQDFVEGPRLLRKKVGEFIGLGDAYLNVQFGWLATLRDIRAMLQVIGNAEKAIAWILQNRDKPIRKVVQLRKEIQSRQIGDNLKFPFPGVYATDEVYGGFPRLYDSWDATFKLDLERKVWFSGKFVFSFDSDKGLPPSRAKLLARYLGVIVTPQDAWNLLPWTFIIDYFASISYALGNLTAYVADEQHSEYAYVMQHTRRKYTWQGTEGYIHASVSRIFDTKVRDAVSPFGLEVGMGLSPRQLGILAALGDTKLLRH